MTMKVEEPYSGYSAENTRSKMQIIEGLATQRRLDYNAPLLSARRFADSNGDVKRNLWKLSSELSKEPLRVRGAVPFTWEHSPGRPKQPVPSPEKPAFVNEGSSKSPRSPSSPSPPQTPSPPISRHASPASPPVYPPPAPPQLHPSPHSAPPPPPPPPPPSFTMSRRTFTASKSHAHPSASSSWTPPPLPPVQTQSFLKAATTGAAQERGRAFRMVDPTEDLLRALRARREKLEPTAFLTSRHVDEESHARSEGIQTVQGAFVTQAKCVGAIREVDASTGTSSGCGVVDVIVQKFLADHADDSEVGGISECVNDSEACIQREKGILYRVDQDDLSTSYRAHPDEGDDVIDNDVAQRAVHRSSSNIISRNRVEMLSRQVPPEEFVNEGMDASRHSHGRQANILKGADPDAMSPIPLSAEPSIKAEEEHASIVRRNEAKRRTGSVAILDSCRVESFRMIRSVLVGFCRRAATASLESLSRAKHKLARSRRGITRSLKVVLHQSGSAALLNVEEKNVGRKSLEASTIQEAYSMQDRKSKEHSIVSPTVSPSASDVALHPVQDYVEADYDRAALKHDAIAIAPSMSRSTSQNATPESNAVQNSMSPPAERSTRRSEQSPDSSKSMHPVAAQKDCQGSSVSYLSPQETTEELNSEVPVENTEETKRSRVGSIRHLYTKSLGDDEANEFYDASSRFGSRNSTPSRVHLNRSMSRDWSQVDEFLDAASSPFETPRNSVSYSSPSTAERGIWRKRPASKLSKRTGKALWVDTDEVKSTDTTEALSSISMKQFYSGEQFPTSKESLNLASPQSRTHIQYQERRCMSSNQINAAASQHGMSYRRAFSGSKTCSSGTNAIPVTPIFPSKCQKNRMMASASGLPRQILTENMLDVGWPLGLSGYPLQKISTKSKAESKPKKGWNASAVVVPCPPLPPSPAGGSWLRKALSSGSLNQAPSLLAKKSPIPNSPNSSRSSHQNNNDNKWEDIVKGSHIQPGHLRFSEELQHQSPTLDAKYDVL
ncbi:hypothetical protein KP509_13G055500 [Ceratopteris richardii]|uniref:Uncharacterized protein n=1 Tax=Ceratopteris richardii TaxID=49495 RepID=A0A8T2TDQ4_CERRI|nr:hypothetical protein KP509_13G055500 [Ceratopteris richardii]